MMGAVLFLASILLPGFAMICAIVGRNERRGAIELTGLTIFLGCGTLGFLLFWFSLAGKTPSQGVLGVISALSVLAIALLARRRMIVLPRGVDLTLARSDIWLVVALPVIAFSMVVVVVHSMGSGSIEWDDTTVWGMKAKVLVRDSLRDRPWYFSDPQMSYSHQDYPLMLSFLRAGIYGALREVNDAKGKGIYPLIYAAMGMIGYAAARRRFSRGASAALIAMYLNLPAMLRLAGSGLSDVPLAAFWLAALASLARWFEEHRRSDLLLGACFTAFTAFTKNEGLALFAVCAAALVALPIIARSRARAMSALSFIAIALVLLGPWLIFRTTLPHTYENYGGKFTLWRILDNTPRLMPVARIFISEFTRLSLWSIFWLLLVLATLLNLGALRRASVQFLWIVLVGQTATYVLTYMVTPWDLYELSAVTTTRLVIQLSPAALLLIAEVAPVIKGPFRYWRNTPVAEAVRS